MIEFLQQPWHWSVSGLLIGLTVPLLLITANKTFGVSSSLRHICAATVPMGIPYFKYNWKDHIWNILFVLGVLLGGVIASTLLANPEEIAVAAKTKSALLNYGISDYSKIIPVEIFSWSNLFSLQGFIFIAFGGFLVGFGVRWADGCTSGHSITGMANLQLSSLVATLFFFIGGLLGTHLLFPIIF